MKQKFVAPSYVYSLELTERNHEYFITGLERTTDGPKSWIFKLPVGTWYAASQNFMTNEIILWNGLKDVLDKFEYIVEITENDSVKYLEYINLKGQEGWELLSSRPVTIKDVFHFELIFKRKIIE